MNNKLKLFSYSSLTMTISLLVMAFCPTPFSLMGKHFNMTALASFISDEDSLWFA